MTHRKCLQLWNDTDLRQYIEALAQRHFVSPEDREDARAEAWERIQRCAANLPARQYRDEARRAIRAAYMRAWRRQKHEREQSRQKTARSRELLDEGSMRRGDGVSLLPRAPRASLLGGS